MSFSMGCFFLMTGLLSCAVARGCENICCLTLVQLPLYVGMLVCSVFIPNGTITPVALRVQRDDLCVCAHIRLNALTRTNCTGVHSVL